MYYMANTSDQDIDHEYAQFDTDAEAINGFLEWAEGESFAILEIWRCADDECLSPERQIYH